LDALGDVLPGPENKYVLGRNVDLLVGPWVSGLPGGAFLDLENAEVAQLEAAVVRYRLDDCIEAALDHLFYQYLFDLHFLRNLSYDVVLGHGGNFLSLMCRFMVGSYHPARLERSS